MALIYKDAYVGFDSKHCRWNLAIWDFPVSFSYLLLHLSKPPRKPFPWIRIISRGIGECDNGGCSGRGILPKSSVLGKWKCNLKFKLWCKTTRKFSCTSGKKWQINGRSSSLLIIFCTGPTVSLSSLGRKTYLQLVSVFPRDECSVACWLLPGKYCFYLNIYLSI